MGYLKALVMVLWLFAATGALAHECPKTKAEYKKELRQKLDRASEQSALLADLLAKASTIDEWEHGILLRAYYYWSDLHERLMEEEIDHAYEKEN